MYCMSRCKLSPGSLVMWDCAVRSLNATFIVVPFRISNTRISPRACFDAHIFSSDLHFVLIAFALVLLCGQPSKSHFSSPPLSLTVPCHYMLLIFLPPGYQSMELSFFLGRTLCQKCHSVFKNNLAIRHIKIQDEMPDDIKIQCINSMYMFTCACTLW